MPNSDCSDACEAGGWLTLLMASRQSLMSHSASTLRWSAGGSAVPADQIRGMFGFYADSSNYQPISLAWWTDRTILGFPRLRKAV